MTLFIARAAFDRRRNNVAIVQLSSDSEIWKNAKARRRLWNSENVMNHLTYERLTCATCVRNSRFTHFCVANSSSIVWNTTPPSTFYSRIISERRNVPIDSNEITKNTNWIASTQRKITLFSMNRSVSQLFIVWYKHSVHVCVFNLVVRAFVETK